MRKHTDGKYTFCTYDDDGNEVEVSVPGCWEICDNCDGHGKHSRHLGAFTQSEFYETFDDEESREDYFAGRYDTKCEECRGDGKIWVADIDHMTEKQLKIYYKKLDADYAYECERAAERRMGC